MSTTRESWPKEKEYYKKLREKHICWICKKTDAYTISGHATCYECTKAKNERQRRYMQNPEARKKQHEKRKEWADKRIENRICLRCGRKLDLWESHQCCKACRVRESERRKIRRAIAERNNTPI